MSNPRDTYVGGNPHSQKPGNSLARATRAVGKTGSDSNTMRMRLDF